MTDTPVIAKVSNKSYNKYREQITKDTKQSSASTLTPRKAAVTVINVNLRTEQMN